MASQNFAVEIKTLKAAFVIISNHWGLFGLQLLVALPTLLVLAFGLPGLISYPFLLITIGWYGAKLYLVWNVYENRQVSYSLVPRLMVIYFKELLYPFMYLGLVYVVILVAEFLVGMAILYVFNANSSQTVTAGDLPLVTKMVMYVAASIIYFMTTFLLVLVIPIGVMTLTSFFRSIKIAVVFFVKHLRIMGMLFLVYALIAMTQLLLLHFLGLTTNGLAHGFLVAISLIILNLAIFVLEVSLFIYLYHHLKEKVNLEKILV
jgi:hypothetical protein